MKHDTRRTASAFLLIAGLALAGFAGRAEAADNAALYALQHQLHSDECTIDKDNGPGASIEHYQIPAAAGSPSKTPRTLYQVPCASTFANTIWSLFVEDGNGLHPLYLPRPNFDFVDTGKAVPKVVVTGFTATNLFSDLNIEPQKDRAYTSSRIAPGTADGALSSTYRLSDGSLIDATAGISGGRHGSVPVVWATNK